jgi:hypothetical protein
MNLVRTFYVKCEKHKLLAEVKLATDVIEYFI